ncbi:MAG: biotin-dependent carboxyltransferase family protein, partial [Jatrophihabitantaceae bacterium]
GVRLPVGPAPAEPPSDAVAPTPLHRAVLDVLPGPRADRFADDVLARLTRQVWTVRGESDRVGVRLDGPSLPRVRDGELASEPTLPGAVQVPTDGRPIVFGPDAPVTGGYPVVAVLTDTALDAAAQLRPGDAVRFRLVRVNRGSGRAPPT